MSTEEKKAVVRRFYEELNKGKEAAMTAMEELYAAPAYVWHGPGVFPDLDRTGMKQMMPAFFTAFPDLHYTVEDLIAEGDKVVSRFTARATHQGEFMGVPATGKVVTVWGVMSSHLHCLDCAGGV
jgi:ketosteroid isomerase-like protein